VGPSFSGIAILAVTAFCLTPSAGIPCAMMWTHSIFNLPLVLLTSEDVAVVVGPTQHFTWYSAAPNGLAQAPVLLHQWSPRHHTRPAARAPCHLWPRHMPCAVSSFLSRRCASMHGCLDEGTHYMIGSKRCGTLRSFQIIKSLLRNIVVLARTQPLESLK
jgi:hypothetical protein